MLRSGRVASVAVVLLPLLLSCHRASVVGPSEPLPTPAPTGLQCGIERWAVKTLSDTDALRVDVSPRATTVEALNGLAEHCGGGPDASRPYQEEYQTFEVIARITLVRHEDDRDYHVAIQDVSTGATIVTEVADSSCTGAANSPFATTLAQARAEFDAVRAGRSDREMEGTLVRVRGVGFFDFNHGQTGRARNCMELHPVLGISRAN